MGFNEIGNIVILLDFWEKILNLDQLYSSKPSLDMRF